MNLTQQTDINNAYRTVRAHLGDMGLAALEQLRHAIEVELREREGNMLHIFERNYIIEKLKET